ncbi:MAG: putative nuclease of restriction endonuclease-like (RecB) superfamily [Sphingobacteriales bacterium]
MSSGIVYTMGSIKQANGFFRRTIELLHLARNNAVKSINLAMVHSYYEIGKMIVEEEQKGIGRADYGKQILSGLSKELTKEFGKGFSIRNIEQMRKFYLAYQKPQTVSAEFKLSWSHYQKLIRIRSVQERQFYEIECVKNNWSIRELSRQFDSALYARLSLTRDKRKVKELSKKGQELEKPSDVIKDPYVLEFLGLPEPFSYSESDLEQRIIDKLEQFMLELGTGFTFVARQKRISFEDKHFRIDLVFYNRILNCFVLIDLKIGEIQHQDLGQMQMYVNYYNREVKLPTENNTIGIVLCQTKSEAVVKYTLPENNEHIFASNYNLVLPSKEDFQQLIQEPEIPYNSA